MKSKIITIDPGNNIGFALWDTDKFERRVLMHPLESGTVSNKDKEKTFYMFERMIINKGPIKKAYMENSKFMKGSETGQVSADSGATVKLSQTIGRIHQILVSNGIKVELVSVASWKGSIPKPVCEKRIRRKLPRLDRKTSNHAMDAIGIGLYKLGKF